MIFSFGLAARIEGMLISQCTKDALAAKKAKGVKLGKPEGTVQASKFDEHREKIEELLAHGVSVPCIATVHLGLNSSAITAGDNAGRQKHAQRLRS